MVFIKYVIRAQHLGIRDFNFFIVLVEATASNKNTHFLQTHCESLQALNTWALHSFYENQKMKLDCYCFCVTAGGNLTYITQIYPRGPLYYYVVYNVFSLESIAIYSLPEKYFYFTIYM